MVVVARAGGVNFKLKDLKRNFILSFSLSLSIFSAVRSEQSTVSIEKLAETSKNTDRSNTNLYNDTTLNETNREANNIVTASNDSTENFCIGQLCVSLFTFIIIISIPIIIILTTFIIFLIYNSRQKQSYQIITNKSYGSERLMQLHLNQKNNFKETESEEFIKSNPETEKSTDVVKPLRNISEESELSRSVLASTSSEQEDENGSKNKRFLVKKRKHY